LFASLAGDSSDDWLMNVFCVQELSDLLSCFISVHERHVAIHHDKIVLAFTEILSNVLFHFFDCLLAIEAVIANRISIDSKPILENDQDCFNIELLIINN
jgi:hypothetical protein